MNAVSPRQPPHFVPTLTDVVRVEPPVAATGPTAPPVGQTPSPSAWSDEAVAQLVDQVTDRVLSAVLQRLEAEVAEQVQVWWHDNAWRCGQDVARTLLNITAGEVRAAVAQALDADTLRGSR